MADEPTQDTQVTEPQETQDSAPEGQEHQDTTDWKAEARKWEARAKENKTAAQEREELASQLEKLQAERDEFAGKATEYEAREQRRTTANEIAKKAGVPADLIRGDTKEDMEAHAESLKAFAATNRPGPVVGAQGKQGRVNVTDPQREAVRNLFGQKE